MHIIQPPHTKTSKEVLSWKEIKEDAKELRTYIKENNGKFEGKFEKAYALAHSQVAEYPRKFFILAEDKEYNLKRIFGHWCIVNLEILDKQDTIDFKEACMSFPHASPKIIQRSFKVKVRYQIPRFGKLKTIEKRLVDIPAIVCQHESGHFEGDLIYK